MWSGARARLDCECIHSLVGEKKSGGGREEERFFRHGVVFFFLSL